MSQRSTPPRSASQSLSRRVLGAMGMFGSVEFLSMACAVVRTKLVAIFIGTAGVGLLGLYSTAMELLATFVQLGLRTTAVRDLTASPSEGRLALLAIVRRYTALLSAVGIVVAMILAPLLSYLTFGSGVHTWAFLALSLVVGCNTLVAGRGAELQAEGHLRTLARASLWATVISLLLAAPMIIWLDMQSIVPLLLTYAGVSCVIYLIATRRPAVSLPEVDPREFRSRIRSMVTLGVFLTVSGCASWLAGYIVLSVINRLGGTSTMGLYQAGYTLTVKYVGVVFTALSLEYFPRLAAALASGKGRGQVMMRHETLLSVAVVSVLAPIMVAFSPWIVRLLYSDSFIDVVPMIIAGAPGLVMRAISWSMAYVLVASGHGRLFMLTELASCFICVVAMLGGFMLAGLFEGAPMTGVGIGFSVWYSLYTLIIWCVNRRRLGFTLGRRVWLLCWSAVLSVVLVAVIALSCPVWLTLPVAIIEAGTWLVVLRRIAVG